MIPIDDERRPLVPSTSEETLVGTGGRAEGLLLPDDVGGPPGQRALALYRLAIQTLEVGNDARAMDIFAKAEAFAVDAHALQETNGFRLRYAKELTARGRRDEARAVLDRLDAVFADYPYPPSLLEDSTALRDALGA